MNKLMFLCIFALLVSVVNGKAPGKESNKGSGKEHRAGSALLTIAKKGGEIYTGRKNKGIRIRLQSITEYRANKDEVITDLKNADFFISKDKNDTSYGISAAVVSYNATVSPGKTVGFSLYVFRENGTITGDDGNEYNVIKGSVKMNIDMDWEIETEKLELEMRVKCAAGTVKGKKSKKSRGKKGKNSKSKRDPSTMAFCPTARITFSPSYKTNNTWKDMPDGYPKTKDNGNGWSPVILSFTGKKITYDPVVEVGDDVSESTQSFAVLHANGSFWIILLTVVFHLL